jgi:hypothetical protein
LIVTRRAITAPVEIAELNAHLLAGLELYMRRNKQMFRKKTKPFTADEFKRRLNDLTDEAERAHIGRPAVLSIMQNVIDNMKYIGLMNATSSYHTSSVIAPPPSPSTKERLLEILRK